MKKFGAISIILLLSVSIFFLGFQKKENMTPTNVYQVYLDSKVIGTIQSKEELENYIDKQGSYIKRKYETDKVYAPNGLEIKKMTTYHTKTDKIEDIYDKINQVHPFTIKGYQFTIKDEKDSTKHKKIFVMDKNIVKEALNETVETFVGKERYQSYLSKTQTPITTTGRVIENIYFKEDMTIKEMNIPVTEKIYKTETELATYLLFGNHINPSDYIVQVGDTISKVAFNNQISVNEFLISNPEFTSENNLLFPGQVVKIGVTDPQIRVVMEEHVVQDIVSKYRTEEKNDPTKLVGEDTIVQKGEDGLERVTEKVQTMNGDIIYVDPKGKEVLKDTITEIVSHGTKQNPVYGGAPAIVSGSWGWPTNSGYTISSGFVYRINPVTGGRELHTGIDITGTGYGSPVYAGNSGVVTVSSYRYDNGNYITINHNNGYYTIYAHLSKSLVSAGQTVTKGQQIGLVGQTGFATCPHLHYELWSGRPWGSGSHLVDPMTLYR